MLQRRLSTILHHPRLSPPVTGQGTAAAIRVLVFAAVHTLLLFGLTRSPLARLPAIRNKGELLFCAISLALVWVFRRFWDRGSLRSLGLCGPHKLRRLALGVLIAALLLLAVFGIELIAGWIEVEGIRAWPISSWIPLVLILIFQHAPIAIAEELVMRGYILQNLEQAWGTKAAVVLSSLLFGVLHMLNCTASGWSLIVIPFSLTLAGMFYALAYICTRSLWLPIGLHFAWNLFEYDVFALAGKPLEQAVFFGTRMTGPAVWVGLPSSAFGPEVGLLGSLAVLAGMALLHFVYIRCTRRKIDEH